MKMLTVAGKSCLLCGGTLLAPEDSEYSRCILCGVTRTKYNYDAEIYKEDYAKTYLNYAAVTSVNIPLNLHRLGIVSTWLRPLGHLLDIGCCIGEFLRFAEPYYSHLVGFEPNHSAARCARSRLHKAFIIETLDLDMKVDVITMWDVLEHIEDPEGFLQAIRKILAPNGVIAITTPNVDIFSKHDDNALRQWKHWKPKEHIWLHSLGSIDRLARKHEFSVLFIETGESQIRPGNPKHDIITVVLGKDGK